MQFFLEWTAYPSSCETYWFIYNLFFARKFLCSNSIVPKILSMHFILYILCLLRREFSLHFKCTGLFVQRSLSTFRFPSCKTLLLSLNDCSRRSRSHMLSVALPCGCSRAIRIWSIGYYEKPLKLTAARLESHHPRHSNRTLRQTIGYLLNISWRLSVHTLDFW